jgi:hypothetical protein
LKTKDIFTGLSIIIVLLCSRCAKQDEFPFLSGPYLGQTPPGDTPELFAPGIICTGLHERDVAMTPDGNEMVFGVIAGNNTYSAIMVSRQQRGRWTKPEIASFSGNPMTRDLEPCISPDGTKFFFVSNRPDTAHGESGEDWDIWVMDRVKDGWSEPYNLGSPVNSDDGEFFPSVTREGVLYFTRGGQTTRTDFIWRSRFAEGRFQEPEKLGPQVNSTQYQYNAFIAPDESYLIVPTFGRDDSYGSTDYYICFRNKEDGWSEPINMGDKVNTRGGLEYSPYVSPDRQYFFFMSTRTGEDAAFKKEKLTIKRMRDRNDKPENGNPDIYWMKADFIDALRPEGF